VTSSTTAWNLHLQSVVRAHLQTWLVRTEHAQWTNSADLKRTFAAASILTAERVVFNIKGNDYKLIAAVSYQAGLVLIKWLVTLADRP
jgi:mRNA interferase HigB